MSNVDINSILNLIKEIGFITYENNIIPEEFYYKGDEYIFERTYRFNESKTYFRLCKKEIRPYLLDDETDLNIVYNVLKNEFKSELRKNKIAKFLDGNR
jgi:hypothetical protein